MVAIIAILAAIAMPNFLEAQTRAKLSRVKSDLRTLTVGLETYAMDHNAFPGASGFFEPVPSQRLESLTTPISYLTTIPRDPFMRRLGNSYEDSVRAFDANEPLDVYLYNLATNQFGPGAIENKINKMSWSLASGGPDRIIEFPYYAFADTFIKSGSHILYVYDPSNGTVSKGEIFRRGGLARTPLPEFND